MSDQIWAFFLYRPFPEKNQMDQHGVIRFLTPQGLKARDIQTELEYIYENGALEIPARKNNCNASRKVESSGDD